MSEPNVSRNGLGGRNAGRERSNKTLPREVRVSKKMSSVLRHNAEKEGLKLEKGGYANVKDLIELPNFKSMKITFDEVRAVVANDQKQRYSMVHVSKVLEQPSAERADDNENPLGLNKSTALPAVDEGDPSQYMVRANQGHSLTLNANNEDMFQPLTLQSQPFPPLVVHGTRKEHWPKILESQGLKPMSRRHVHFTTGVPAPLKKKLEVASRSYTLNTEASAAVMSDEADSEVALISSENSPAVISGMRNSSNVLLFLDIKRAMESGMRFWVSDNGVILTEGNEEGLVPLQFLEAKFL